jgi:hypothetical protein
MFVNSPPEVIPKCLHIKYNIAKVINIECPEYIVQVEVLPCDSPLPADKALAVIVELLGLLARGAGQVGEIVNQVLQEVPREVRVILHRSVLVRQQQVALPVERVVAYRDVSLVGLRSTRHILILNILLFTKVVLLGLYIVELILRLKILSKELKSS